MSFCSDVDILRYEPVLFGELHLQCQVLCSGSGGVLDGTSFTVSDNDLVASGVQAGGVIYLRDGEPIVGGCFEIVSVESASELTVSVIRGDKEEAAVGPASASEVEYRISTFGPQINEAEFELSEQFGMQPGDAESDLTVDEVLDTGSLKRMCVFSVISSVYAMLASGAGDENFWKKSLYYRRLFEKAKERSKVCFDTDVDGVAEKKKAGGWSRLRRD